MKKPSTESHRVKLQVGAVSLVVHLPAGTRRVACVVACHGLRGSKDSDKYLLRGEAFTRAGIALARFDFRGSGESDGLVEADTTVASQMEDALSVVGFLRLHPRLDARFALLGSSMGSCVALHARAAEPRRLVIIPGADHRITDPEHRRQAVALSVGWVETCL